MSDQSTLLKTEIGYFQNQRTVMLKYIPVSATKILEVGCGEGEFCHSLNRSDREIWGVEINIDAAQKAEQYCNRVLVGDINAVYDQLPKNYFDVIIFNDVLEHIYAPWETIQLVKSMLCSTGLVVSSIPNFRYISNLITEILFNAEFRYKAEGGILDDTHIRFFTYKSIKRMFQEQGYEVLVNEGINPCKSWKEKLFISLTLGLLKDARYKQFATVAKLQHS